MNFLLVVPADAHNINIQWGALLLTILGTLSFNMHNKFKN
jgi:hypothetical protein